MLKPTKFETYRGFVYPWHIDHIGHMNVQHYVSRFDEASWNFLAHFGITPSYLSKNKRGIVAVEQTIKYQREVLAGTLICIRSRLLEAKEKVLIYEHLMYNSETDDQVADMRLVVVHIDTETRKSHALPVELQAKIQAQLTE